MVLGRKEDELHGHICIVAAQSIHKILLSEQREKKISSI